MQLMRDGRKKLTRWRIVTANRIPCFGQVSELGRRIGRGRFSGEDACSRFIEGSRSKRWARIKLLRQRPRRIGGVVPRKHHEPRSLARGALGRGSIGRRTLREGVTCRQGCEEKAGPPDVACNAHDIRLSKRPQR